MRRTYAGDCSSGSGERYQPRSRNTFYRFAANLHAFAVADTPSKRLECPVLDDRTDDREPTILRGRLVPLGRDWRGLGVGANLTATAAPSDLIAASTNLLEVRHSQRRPFDDARGAVPFGFRGGGGWSDRRENRWCTTAESQDERGPHRA